jgi:addiction module HigA family antidote
MTNHYLDTDIQIMTRKPTHPGAILREEFMPDYGLSVATLAELLSVSRQSIHELIREKRAISTSMALRLGRIFGTSPDFWLNLQRKVDIWDELDLHLNEYEEIKLLIA